MTEPYRPQPGTVYLIGAGPGDPGLITVRGLAVLRAADVILHDRLIPAELLGEVRDGAELIDVSKVPGRRRIDQDEIQKLLIDRARRGLRVARLKGGDPLIFGRGGEEVEACAAAGVPVVVIPGVSSATAAPAAAGIPLTHRGQGRSFAVVTAESDPDFGPYVIPYGALAGIDTIVILMGCRRLGEIVEGLLATGLAPDTPAACISQGWTDRQQAVRGTLQTIADRVQAAGLAPPVVTIIGRVAGFCDCGNRER